MNSRRGNIYRERACSSLIKSQIIIMHATCLNFQSINTKKNALSWLLLRAKYAREREKKKESLHIIHKSSFYFIFGMENFKVHHKFLLFICLDFLLVFFLSSFLFGTI